MNDAFARIVAICTGGIEVAEPDPNRPSALGRRTCPMVRSDQTMPSWFSASRNLVASVSGRTHLLTAAKIHELLFDLPATARFAIVKDA